MCSNNGAHPIIEALSIVADIFGGSFKRSFEFEGFEFYEMMGEVAFFRFRRRIWEQRGLSLRAALRIRKQWLGGAACAGQRQSQRILLGLAPL